MASEYTKNYNLDKYASTDKPNLRDQYNSAMDKIDDEIEKLNTKFNSASNGVYAFTQTAKEITENYKSINSRIADNEKSIKESIANFENTKKYVHDELEKTNADVKDNSNKLKTADDDRHTLHSMIDTVSTRVTGLTDDVDVAKQSMHKIEKTLGEFQEKITTNKQEVDKSITAIHDDVEKAKNDTTANLALIKNDMQTHAKKYDEIMGVAQQDIAGLKHDIATTNKTVTDQSVRDNENFLRVAKDVSTNKANIDINTKNINQHSTEISELKTKEQQDNDAQQKLITANTAQLSSHATQLQEHVQRLTTLENTSKQHVEKSEGYFSKVDTALGKIATLDSDLTSAKRSIADQSVRDDTNYNEVKGLYTGLNERVQQNEQKIETLKTGSGTISSDEISNIKTEVQQLDTKAKEQYNTIQTMGGKIDTHEQQLKDRYTKAESDDKFAKKNDVYNKGEVDTKFSHYADINIANLLQIQIIPNEKTLFAIPIKDKKPGRTMWKQLEQYAPILTNGSYLLTHANDEDRSNVLCKTEFQSPNAPGITVNFKKGANWLLSSLPSIPFTDAAIFIGLK
nr:MAG TPA: coiled-coil domain-containing protein [Caudoviricetes sp.]